MLGVLEKLTANVPKGYFKLPMADLEPTGTSYYATGGVFYEEFRHKENPGLRLIVDVDQNVIISFKIGKYFITV